jgi:hypothetical protein
MATQYLVTNGILNVSFVSIYLLSLARSFFVRTPSMLFDSLANNSEGAALKRNHLPNEGSNDTTNVLQRLKTAQPTVTV